MEQVHPGTATYSMPMILEYGGDLQVEILERSLQELVRRHEILRTTFGIVSGTPVQHVAEAGEAMLEVHGEGGKAAEQQLREAIERPFNLERGPLLRAVLIRRGLGWALLLNMHHIVSDGWSVGIMQRELATLYQAFAEGLTSPLEHLRVQYGDYAVWQREWLQGSRLDRLLEYWRGQLTNMPEVTPLPVDRARPTRQSTKGASLGFRMGRTVTAGIKELAKSEGVTEFMVLLTAFALLLERYTGQTQIMIGTPVATRTRPELEMLVGYFVNMLPLRIDLGEEQNVRQVLQRVRQTTLAAYEHQELPFEHLVSALKVRRSLAYTPVFQVVFALQNLPGLEMIARGPSIGEKSLWLGEVYRGNAKFDLTLALMEANGELVGAIEYRTDLFADQTISNLVRHYAKVVQTMIADPEQNISAVLELSSREREELVSRCEKSLPEIAETLTAETTAPATATEALLTRVWKEVLEKSEIGTEENFFDIGGNSINALRVMARVYDLFQVELPVHVLFEASTVRTLSTYIENGRLEVGLLPQCDDGEVITKGNTQNGSITRAPRESLRIRGPMSFAQERLWFLEQLEPGLPLYNVLVSLRFASDLSVPLLKRTLTEVVRRHDVLRTHFTGIRGIPEQTVALNSTVDLKQINLQQIEGERQSAELIRKTDAELRRPFDLTKGPLFRATLLSLGSLGHFLVMAIHHTIIDGWSVKVLTREVYDIYECLRDGRALPPELNIQYLDFARWQRRRMRGETLNHLLSYWRGALAGAPAVLELPYDRPRPLIESHQGAVLTFEITKRVVDAFKAIAHRVQTTTFSVFLAAFKLFLARLSGSEDIVVGTPVTNRTRVETEPLIGLVANTLVLRTDLSRSTTFLELVHHVSIVLRSAIEHQELPFERLVEELQPARSLSHNPLFQVMILFNDASANPVVEPQPLPFASGVDKAAPSMTSGTAKFDLTLSLTDLGQSVSAGFEYSTDLFDGETIANFIRQFNRLLSSISDNPEEQIWLLSMVSQQEWSQMLRAWKRKPANLLPLAHQNVNRLSGSVGNEIAVLSEGTSLTYRDLEARAGQVSYFLRSRGVKSGQPVAICLPRGLDLAVAVLGTLKAGAAYVPVDPTYPIERKSFMISDSGATVMISDESSPNLRLPAQCDIITMNEIRSIRVESKQLNFADPNPDDPAYIMYTSGSTGRPKGVVMPHAPLAYLVSWQATQSGVAARRTLQFAPPSFDVSYQEMLSTWAVGGTLVLIDDLSRRDPELLTAALDYYQISRIFIPYVTLQQLAEYSNLHDVHLPSLCEVITAGEQLVITSSIRSFFRRHPAVVLRNQYGPTESHVATQYTLHRDPDLWPALPPIGKPIPSAQVYVLARRGQPVPPGAIGEIYLGGDCLSSGYVNRPVETSERFMDDPWSGTATARMYRTGDLGRQLRTGDFLYLGRADSQIKIRGYRVEPGEVEVVLTEHPAVSEAVVVSNGEGHMTCLAAYVRLKSPNINADDLRKYLSTRLPQFMVPTLINLVSEIPKTPSGKIDRSVLKKLVVIGGDDSRPDLSGTHLELAIANRWSRLLARDNVGLDQDLFDLGAHSLMTIQFVVWAQSTLGMEIPVRVVFQNPTVRLQAQTFAEILAQDICCKDAVSMLDEAERRCGVITASSASGGALWEQS
jgi:amino acid adenylation domain-containing protein